MGNSSDKTSSLDNVHSYMRLLKFFLLIQVVLLNITVGDKLIIEQTDELLSEAPEDTDYTPPERIKVKFNLLNLFF